MKVLREKRCGDRLVVLYQEGDAFTVTADRPEGYPPYFCNVSTESFTNLEEAEINYQKQAE